MKESHSKLFFGKEVVALRMNLLFIYKKLSPLWMTAC
ncbi:MAG: hypothetical protein JWM63_2365 [Gammaproteobacteria bacterium]|jgi:hypothetical protein|nr:hypothetical protein [Gammaproteobacteria bacterium]